MSKRKTVRALALLLSLAAAVCALMGGAAYGLYAEKSVLVQEQARLERTLADTSQALARQKSLYAEKEEQARSLLDQANRSAELEEALDSALLEQAAAESAAKLQTSLAQARLERAGELSDENEALRADIDRLLAQAAQEHAEIDRLGALLTEREEALAGAQALYQETVAALAEARQRSADEGAELETLYAKLTLAEENYAGASALLQESDARIALAMAEAASYYYSMQAMRIAAEARQAELFRLRAQLTDPDASSCSMPRFSSFPHAESARAHCSR